MNGKYDQYSDNFDLLMQVILSAADAELGKKWKIYIVKLNKRKV